MPLSFRMVQLAIAVGGLLVLRRRWMSYRAYRAGRLAHPELPPDHWLRLWMLSFAMMLISGLVFFAVAILNGPPRTQSVAGYGIVLGMVLLVVSSVMQGWQRGAPPPNAP